MATKVLIQVQGNLYDFWEFRSLQRREAYNETTGSLDYQLILNEGSIGTNYAEVVFAYPTEELREKDYISIKQQLDYFEGVLFIDAGMPLAEIKAALQPLMEQYGDTGDAVDG